MTDELYEKYCSSGFDENPDNAVVFGRLLTKLFPMMSRSQNVRSKINPGRFTRKCYFICLKEDESSEKLGLDQLQTRLPGGAMALSIATDTSMSFAVPSGYTSNGNMVSKNVFITGARWKLCVRGKTINLDHFGISDNFESTVGFLKSVTDTVDKIPLCLGLPTEKVSSTIKPSFAIREHISRVGDENSSQIRFRSPYCMQLRTWQSSGELSCRRCQVDLRSEEHMEITMAASIDKVKQPPVHTNSVADDENEEDQDDDEESVVLDEDDNSALSQLLEALLPGADQEMKTLLMDQRQALKASRPNARRWSKEVISLCLNLYVRSPKSYEDLKDSKALILPSTRQLSRYKNFIPQRSGLNRDVLKWMCLAAQEAKLPKQGWAGGLIHDETKIQPDLVMNMTNGAPKLIGWVDTGEEGGYLRVLREGQLKQKLATEAFQVIFLGYTGFRFPVFHCPTDGINAADLCIIIHELISELARFGFQVDFILQDGGQENRQFIKAHFEGDPADERYACQHTFDPDRKLMMSQDFSHNMKKLRNSVISSGIVTGKHRRLLMHNGLPIVWQQWVDAVNWDRNTNSRLIHFRITDSHLHPSQTEKMRNQLAEDMLNEEMLNLMLKYQSSLRDGSHLQSAIDLLQQTSCMIKIFRDKRPVEDVADNRLQQLRDVLAWFIDWEQEHKSGHEKASKHLPSEQCMEDVKSMLFTFEDVCRVHLHDYPGSSVNPSRFNSDLVENHFCQTRGLKNGNTTNPTYDQYCKTVNSIILGQSLKSRRRKSNAGIVAAKPFNFYIKKKKVKRNGGTKQLRV